MFSNRERGRLCSDSNRVCGEIERGSVRGERKRFRDKCVQNDRNVFMSRDRESV